ncbi:N-acetylglutamate synthase-like GNAT family acetyltransferase [Aliiruegeria haliotis]|uniref:N-acetylglutamate synthase-like GNAT family acetyltransferase n=1 Tax=Aliiruegeria haliotis TaxID=1280846 RepID=A0A2T0RYT5_9RHOB|nr:GNAT family N-acetyltransferase [Aliiruegeria haliotis]PRY26302.1 N-acetylglutamate synthase-like GNAT family acetyltransferase [Aliiruegeria haliotis]
MKLRTMTRSELPTILEWAAAEGWNPGHDDAPAFHAADPEGFFVAERDGRLAAAISVINHSDSFAFLGLYICHPEFRGQGVGLALWNHALEHAGSRIVGLDGVPDQQANYRRSGFVAASETTRFEGTLPGASRAGLRVATDADTQEMIARCAAANGYGMDRFLSVWFRPEESRQSVVLDGADGGMAGFATWRHCRNGVKIGPLVAEDLATATALIDGIAARHPEVRLVIDVPREMTSLAEHCKAVGMTSAFSTARMYRGTAPVPGAGIHTIATLELG